MPELAEVVYYSQQWDPGLGGRILRVHAHSTSRVFRKTTPAAILSGLHSAKYVGASTHGKNMLFQFSKKLWLHGHLGMTGSLSTEAPDYLPSKHDHLVLFQKQRALVFKDPRMFGTLSIEESGSVPQWWSALPPEILSAGFNARHVLSFFQRRARTPLKAALLDQECFPGIGNWMADEILWQLRLHPATPAGSLNAATAQALVKSAKSITKTALRTIGQTWSDPPKSWLFLHRWKDDGLCPRCGNRLSREELRGRTACWCRLCAGGPN